MEQEMKYIYAIYEEGNFSKAAEKLYMTQSALSMAVQRVEDALGDKIFDRGKRPLKLTLVGEVYIQKYYEINQLEKEMQEQINDIDNLKSGKLVIGGSQYILSYILPPVLVKYTSMYPHVDIRLVEYGSNQLDDKLLDGSIDLCLKCEKVKSPLGMVGEAFTDNLFLVMPKSFIKKYNLPNIGVSRDLIVSNEYCSDFYPSLDCSYWSMIPLLVLSPGNNLRKRVIRLFEENDMKPNIFMEMQQLVTAYRIAVGGLGATLTTDFIIKKNLDPDAVYFKLDSSLIKRDFQFIMNKKGYISKAVRRFMEMTREEYFV